MQYVIKTNQNVLLLASLVKHCTCTIFFMFRYVDPSEMTRPSKPADLKVNSIPIVILHGFIVNHIDDGNHKCSGFIFDPL